METISTIFKEFLFKCLQCMQFTTSVAKRMQVVEELSKAVEAVAKKYEVTPEGQLARKIRLY